MKPSNWVAEIQTPIEKRRQCFLEGSREQATAYCDRYFPDCPREIYEERFDKIGECGRVHWVKVCN